MRTTDLIALLQKLVDEHEPHKEMLGEHEVMIDVWRKGYDNNWHYRGFSPNIEIGISEDGVYPIIQAEESWT